VSHGAALDGCGGQKISCPTRVGIAKYPARIESLYRLRYAGRCKKMHSMNNIKTIIIKCVKPVVSLFITRFNVKEFNTVPTEIISLIFIDIGKAAIISFHRNGVIL
jgi:hypothetical protein